MRITLLAIMMLINCPQLSAKDNIVYRWVDENNVVHYSHEHPADKDYAEIKVHVAYGSASTLNASFDANAKEEANKEDSAEISRRNAEQIKQNCESAKVNLNVLESFDRILIKDDNDQEKVLNEEEKAEQVELSKKYIDIYCNTDS